MQKIGIIGYGKLGRYLCAAIQEREDQELAFVWNRNPDRFGTEIPKEKILSSLSDFSSHPCDLIVEVAHPIISKKWGSALLEKCDYMVGSPTALADQETERVLFSGAQHHGLYIPRGALPGLEEVLSMRARNKLSAASITMRKHPKSLKFSGPLRDDQKEAGCHTYYHGPLRQLCGYAPNNVNTMAVLALSSGLGFDAVEATLVADTSLEHHITMVSLFGPGDPQKRYSLELIRKSPAGAGAVTSTATFDSFLGSMNRAHSQGSGIHFC